MIPFRTVMTIQWSNILREQESTMGMQSASSTQIRYDDVLWCRGALLIAYAVRMDRCDFFFWSISMWLRNIEVRWPKIKKSVDGPHEWNRQSWLCERPTGTRRRQLSLTIHDDAGSCWQHNSTYVRSSHMNLSGTRRDRWYFRNFEYGRRQWLSTFTSAIREVDMQQDSATELLTKFPLTSLLHYHQSKQVVALINVMTHTTSPRTSISTLQTAKQSGRSSSPPSVPEKYRNIGGIDPQGWGSNAQKDLTRREFWVWVSLLT